MNANFGGEQINGEWGGLNCCAASTVPCGCNIDQSMGHCFCFDKSIESGAYNIETINAEGMKELEKVAHLNIE